MRSEPDTDGTVGGANRGRSASAATRRDATRPYASKTDRFGDTVLASRFRGNARSRVRVRRFSTNPETVFERSYFADRRGNARYPRESFANGPVRRLGFSQRWISIGVRATSRKLTRPRHDQRLPNIREFRRVDRIDRIVRRRDRAGVPRRRSNGAAKGMLDLGRWRAPGLFRKEGQGRLWSGTLGSRG
ncbi:uncharacterized protein LOC143147884 [Ptiloglossa arizonensis]|uniref:uncharacterized protein LOC143147884 n=1 Tax=Ptiloglossa arizonensis TaxID=3350558 RepID=UPI003FA08AF5